MLELGAAQPQNDLVKDVSEATFMADVVEESQNQPVIVDFWAPWCGPCKTLGPALEEAVQAAGGKVKMAKVDIDQNQMIASQMRVQSIPAVFAFVDGQPIDGFMGALPPSEIKEFVDKVVAAGGGGDDGGLEEALDAADQMLEEGAVVDAAQTYAAVLGEEPNNGRAFVGLIKAQMEAGETEQAREMLDNAPDGLKDTKEVNALRAQLELADLAAETGETAELRAALEKNADDHQARFDLAIAEFAAGQSEAAIDLLLELFRRDRDWNEDAARQQLFKIFDTLGPEDELAKSGRRRLASMIFA